MDRPGDLLRAKLATINMGVNDFARRSKINKAHLSRVMTGKARFTPEWAMTVAAFVTIFENGSVDAEAEDGPPLPFARDLLLAQAEADYRDANARDHAYFGALDVVWPQSG